MIGQIILDRLIEKKILTASQEAVLKNTASEREFLSRVASIYEAKQELFLTACEFDATRALKGRGIKPADIRVVTMQKIMECVYSFLLNIHGFSTVPMLMHMLEGNGDDLLDSLGLKAISVGEEHLDEVARCTFKSYTARMQLFHDVGMERLQDIVARVSAEDGAIFPPRLYNAFVIETHLSGVMARAVAGTSEREFSGRMAAVFRANVPAIFECVESVAGYLGTVVNGAGVSQAKKERYFRYLSSLDNQTAFARAIAGGFIDGMIQEVNQLKVKRKKMEVMSSTVSQACLPALTLIGIPIELDMSRLHQSIAAIKKMIKDNEARKAVIDKEYEKAKVDAHQQIDKWRSGIPDRPVTWGVQLVNLRF